MAEGGAAPEDLRTHPWRYYQDHELWSQVVGDPADAELARICYEAHGCHVVTTARMLHISEYRMKGLVTRLGLPAPVRRPPDPHARRCWDCGTPGPLFDKAVDQTGVGSIVARAFCKYCYPLSENEKRLQDATKRRNGRPPAIDQLPDELLHVIAHLGDSPARVVLGLMGQPLLEYQLAARRRVGLPTEISDDDEFPDFDDDDFDTGSEGDPEEEDYLA